MKPSKHVLLAALSLGAVLPMLSINGCLVSSSSNVTHSGTYISNVTFNQITDGTTTQSWVAAILGPPTATHKLDDGIDIWQWSYTQRTDSSGAVFLVFGGSSSEEKTGTAYVQMKDGIVTKHWRG